MACTRVNFQTHGPSADTGCGRTSMVRRVGCAAPREEAVRRYLIRIRKLTSAAAVKPWAGRSWSSWTRPVEGQDTDLERGRDLGLGIVDVDRRRGQDVRRPGLRPRHPGAVEAELVVAVVGIGQVGLHRRQPRIAVEAEAEVAAAVAQAVGVFKVVVGDAVADRAEAEQVLGRDRARIFAGEAQRIAPGGDERHSRRRGNLRSCG